MTHIIHTNLDRYLSIQMEEKIPNEYWIELLDIIERIEKRLEGPHA